MTTFEYQLTSGDEEALRALGEEGWEAVAMVPAGEGVRILSRRAVASKVQVL